MQIHAAPGPRSGHGKAEGHVDLYPRLAPTHEWDIAAGYAIVAAAGGTVVKPNGAALTYGRFADGFCVPSVVAFGDYCRCENLSNCRFDLNR
jgi:3'(2'), 5'-bisphosphate nucleotidase